jgi:putative thioredoxin
VSEQGAVVVREVAEADFDQQVVEASKTRPVVVDFWAPWCQPCHQLAPVLERVAQRHTGDVDLVKVNIDQAPLLARRYGVQGIPNVKAFKAGQVVGEFTGVQPEHIVERLFGGLAPSAADRLVDRAMATDSVEERERLLVDALAEDPGHPVAVVERARLHLERGEPEAARDLLVRAPSHAEARRLLAELSFADDADVDLDELRAQAGVGDPAAWLRLGRAHAARGDHAEALPALIEAVRDPDTREDARTAVLEVFALLGDDHTLTRQWRPRLAAALF